MANRSASSQRSGDVPALDVGAAAAGVGTGPFAQETPKGVDQPVAVPHAVLGTELRAKSELDNESDEGFLHTPLRGAERPSSPDAAAREPFYPGKPSCLRGQV